MALELRDLVIVSNIATYGSIHAAAAELCLSQPALTKRLKVIEEKIGLKLFHRLPRGVRLTPSGETFVARSKELLVHARDFETVIKRHQQGQDQTLRVGVKPGLHDIFFRKSMIAFSQDYPNVNLEIEMNSSPTLCSSIRAGQLDVAIVALNYKDEAGNDPALHPSLKFQPLFELPLEVVVRNDHPIFDQHKNAPEQILQFPLACPMPPPAMISNMKSKAKSIGVTFNGPNILFDDYEFILSLIARSNYWTAIFEANNDELKKKDRFRYLFLPEILPPMTIGVVTRSTWVTSPSAENLINYVKRYKEK